VQKVIGYEGIQRYMPVNYVQAHQDWIEETAKKLQKNVPQARGTHFTIYCSRQDVTVDFYPLQARGTGPAFAVYAGGGRWAWAGAAAVRLGVSEFSKLMSIKNSRLTELMQQHPNQRPGR
jgi:hypothetical protein